MTAHGITSFHGKRNRGLAFAVIRGAEAQLDLHMYAITKRCACIHNADYVCVQQATIGESLEARYNHYSSYMLGNGGKEELVAEEFDSRPRWREVERNVFFGGT